MKFGGWIRKLWLWPGVVAGMWLAMLAVHESGHVAAAWLAGGTGIRLEMDGIFSRTVVDQNPHPVIEVWSGPVVGGLLPLGLWLIMRGRYLVQAWAAFCLLANGLYLAAGAWMGVGDTGELVKLGISPWMACAPGTAMASAGLLLAHWLGVGLGLTRSSQAK